MIGKQTAELLEYTSEVIYVFAVSVTNSSHSELVSLITNGLTHTPAGVILSTGGSPSVQPPNFTSSTSRPANQRS